MRPPREDREDIALRRRDQLPPEQQRAVRALAERLGSETGSPPLNDESLARLTGPGRTHLCLHAAGELVGYAQLDDGAAELAVPAEHAAELLDAVEAAAGSPLRIWTHGARSTIAPLLPDRGYARTRLLHQLRMPLDGPLPEVALPGGVSVRPFAVGTDEDAWLGVNAAAFAGHAEQGGWTRADLAAREAEPWFDPAGFLLAWRGGELLGFHWTKVHPAMDGADRRSGRRASGDARSRSDGIGEVYVLGVAPAAQGMRLGAALLAAGLRHLADRGCPEVLLYVDDANRAAIRLYERFGFRRHDLDAQWVLD